MFLKTIELFTKVVAWLQIALSPTIIGIVIGGIIYLAKPDAWGMAIGITIAAAGLLLGISWATNIWKRVGTNNFLGKLLSLPEMEKKDEEAK